MLQKGFTLIELMIVVAIIGILSMFALPAYQDYTKRTYVSEGMALSTAAKMAATEFYSTEGKWPQSNKEAGVAEGNAITGQAVNSIWMFAGTAGKDAGAPTDPADPSTGTPAVPPSGYSNIAIYYNSKVTGDATDNTAVKTAPPAGSDNIAAALVIAPTADSVAGSVKWACTSIGDRLQEKWLPANCRNDIKSKAKGK